jgi:hypothetical protein
VRYQVIQAPIVLSLQSSRALEETVNFTPDDQNGHTGCYALHEHFTPLTSFRVTVN